MHEAGYRDYLDISDLPEAEFVASGDAGDVQLLTFQNLLNGRILTTGFHGDKIWDPRNRKVGDQVVRGDNSGSSLGEYRLRVGFVHMPIPFIGCRRHADIQAISQSPEMDPWRIGGSYDRPIARRIVEEAGVPRSGFARHKLATAVWWGFKPPKSSSHDSYVAYRNSHRRAGIQWREHIHSLLYRISRFWWRNSLRAQRVLSGKVGLCIEIPQVVPRQFTEPADQSQLFQWGISIVRSRYTND